MIDNYLFKTTCVRDLAWVCYSPRLLSELPDTQAELFQINSPGQSRDLENWLNELDQNPTPLLQHLADLKSPRLGIYYEALNAFYWQHFPGRQLLAQNLQVQSKRKTLGEFDLITRDQQQLYHIELAVKFYLGIPDSCEQAHSQWQQWIGPNCNDRLDIKLQRLQQHQLKLSYTEAGRQALKQWQTTPIHCALQFQGYLFYPAHRNMPHPKFIADNHLRGSWYYLEHFISALSIKSNSLWYELPKAQWLAHTVLPLQHPSLLDQHSIAQQLQNYFSVESSQHQRPLLLVELKQRQDYLVEASRCFVVADNWPWNDKLLA